MDVSIMYYRATCSLSEGKECAERELGDQLLGSGVVVATDRARGGKGTADPNLRSQKVRRARLRQLESSGPIRGPRAVRT